MNVVDSSGWLEYFADAANADFFAPAIEAPSELFVPSISLYEVFKRVLQQRDETAALEAIAVMQSGQVIDLDAIIAINAAALSHKYKLPMADSIILATAIQFEAELWTQDADFKDVPNVHYAEKK
ncbi:MAG: type II toxin-antitoxin system VapC family toxin [Anaerolineales bacterium]|jgi:predicted nucleic acid-binding protein